MQTQQTRGLQVLQVQFVALALGLFVALMLAGTFGFWLRGVSLGTSTGSSVTAGAVGEQQIAHNRSEEGLGGSGSAGGQQIAHNRSEEGLSS